jgi:hypothetical protein
MIQATLVLPVIAVFCVVRTIPGLFNCDLQSADKNVSKRLINL